MITLETTLKNEKKNKLPSFTMSASVDTKEYNSFLKHDSENKLYRKSDGKCKGEIIYELRGVEGLGTKIDAKCICGAKKDITDYFSF